MKTWGGCLPSNVNYSFYVALAFLNALNLNNTNMQCKHDFSYQMYSISSEDYVGCKYRKCYSSFIIIGYSLELYFYFSKISTLKSQLKLSFWRWAKVIWNYFIATCWYSHGLWSHCRIKEIVFFLYLSWSNH